MKQYLVAITCDVNDADYIKSCSVQSEEGLERIRKALDTINRLKKSYYELRTRLVLSVPLNYRDNLPYYGDVMEPILGKYKWRYSDNKVRHLEWVNSLPKEDIEDALYLYDLLPSFEEEEVYTIDSIEAYEITGEKLDLI